MRRSGEPPGYAGCIWGAGGHGVPGTARPANLGHLPHEASGFLTQSCLGGRGGIAKRAQPAFSEVGSSRRSTQASLVACMADSSVCKSSIYMKGVDTNPYVCVCVCVCMLVYMTVSVLRSC